MTSQVFHVIVTTAPLIVVKPGAETSSTLSTSCFSPSLCSDALIDGAGDAFVPLSPAVMATIFEFVKFDGQIISGHADQSS